MKRLISLFALVGGALATSVALAKRPFTAKRLEYEARKRAHIIEFVEHSHEATTHIHQHYHVTHNHREGLEEVLGEWEHLTARHDHDHNHSAITHSHAAHLNAEHEHLGEAHLHDHAHPATS